MVMMLGSMLEWYIDYQTMALAPTYCSPISPPDKSLMALEEIS